MCLKGLLTNLWLFVTCLISIGALVLDVEVSVSHGRSYRLYLFFLQLFVPEIYTLLASVSKYKEIHKRTYFSFPQDFSERISALIEKHECKKNFLLLKNQKFLNPCHNSRNLVSAIRNFVINYIIPFLRFCKLRATSSGKLISRTSFLMASTQVHLGLALELVASPIVHLSVLTGALNFLK